MRLTHPERRARREAALAAVRDGEPIKDVAVRFGMKVPYLRILASAKRVPVVPVTYIRSLRRQAQVAEIISLGFSLHQCAGLLGVKYHTAAYWARKAGIDSRNSGPKLDAARKASRERAATMAALYRDGRTLDQIGQSFGISRERVRQLMTKHFGMRWTDGGQHAQTERNRVARATAREAACLKKWGCSLAQYRELCALQKPTRAYAYQKNNARRRGIPWEFTLLSWWTVWQASGKWDERGRGLGYVMCRNGDAGPYSPSNVRIARGFENSAEGQARKKIDPSLPIGVKRTKSGRYSAKRSIRGVKVNLGTHDTPDLAYAAYLRAYPAEARAA